MDNKEQLSKYYIGANGNIYITQTIFKDKPHLFRVIGLFSEKHFKHIEIH